MICPSCCVCPGARVLIDVPRWRLCDQGRCTTRSLAEFSELLGKMRGYVPTDGVFRVPGLPCQLSMIPLYLSDGNPIREECPSARTALVFDGHQFFPVSSSLDRSKVIPLDTFLKKLGDYGKNFREDFNVAAATIVEKPVQKGRGRL